MDLNLHYNMNFFSDDNQPIPETHSVIILHCNTDSAAIDHGLY